MVLLCFYLFSESLEILGSTLKLVVTLEVLLGVLTCCKGRIKRDSEVVACVIVVYCYGLGRRLGAVSVYIKKFAVYAVLVSLLSILELLKLKIVFSYGTLKSCSNDMSKVRRLLADSCKGVLLSIIAF